MVILPDVLPPAVSGCRPRVVDWSPARARARTTPRVDAVHDFLIVANRLPVDRSSRRGTRDGSSGGAARVAWSPPWSR